MGKVLSVVGNRVNRSIYRINAENRAHKVLSQQIPTPAPKYEVDKRELDNLMKESPHIFEEMKKKDPALDDKLKQIYVTSSDPEPKVLDKMRKPSEKRILPVDRSSKSMNEICFEEPDVIPVGKISLKQALTFLAQHHSNPDTYNKYYVSDNYKITKEDAENILKYFKTFNVYIPPKQQKISAKDKLHRFLDSQTRFDNSVDDSQQKLP